MDKRKTVILQLTHRCNLDCVYCYEKNVRHRPNMELSIAQKIIQESFDKYKNDYEEVEFDFMGGEPLLEFETIKTLVEWIDSIEPSLPYIFFASTNGTLLDDSRKKWFADNQSKIVLGLSYDGNEEMQNVNRTNSANAIDLSFYVKTWPFQTIKMTLSPRTIDKFADGIISLCEKGACHVTANLAYGEEWTKEHLHTYAQQLNILVDFFSTHPEYNVPDFFLLKLSSILDRPNTEKYCGAGMGMSFYDYDGKEYPCHVLSPLTLTETQLENIKEVDYENGIFFANDTCRQCILYNICHNCCGMNYLYYGGFKGRSWALCQGFKILVVANINFQYRYLQEKQKNKASLSPEDSRIMKAINTLLTTNLVKNG